MFRSRREQTTDLQMAISFQQKGAPCICTSPRRDSLSIGIGSQRAGLVCHYPACRNDRNKREKELAVSARPSHVLMHFALENPTSKDYEMWQPDA